MEGDWYFWRLTPEEVAAVLEHHQGERWGEVAKIYQAARVLPSGCGTCGGMEFIYQVKEWTEYAIENELLKFNQ